MSYVPSLKVIKEISTDLYNLTDEEIVSLIHKETNKIERERLISYLIIRCNSIIYQMTKKFFVKRATKEDIRQEVLIGFLNAIKNYNHIHPFKSFATLCIKRHCITVIKHANRKKNLVMNDACSLNTYYHYEDGERDVELIEKLAASKKYGPEYNILRNEDIIYCNKLIKKIMTKLEYKAWIGYVLGLSYQEISERMGISKKSLDNALQRAKEHLRKEYDENPNLTNTALKYYILNKKDHEEEEKSLLA